jgi:citrate lyase beta subunit
MSTRARRSCLPVPGSSARMRSKARALAPDEVIVDLEDGVAAALLPDGTGLEAQIETARGLVEVERIAAAGHGLEALVFGPADLAASLGIPVLTIGAGTSGYAFARIAVAARGRRSTAAQASGASRAYSAHGGLRCERPRRAPAAVRPPR